jgi:hypothetical protein
VDLTQFGVTFGVRSRTQQPNAAAARRSRRQEPILSHCHSFRMRTGPPSTREAASSSLASSRDSPLDSPGQWQREQPARGVHIWSRTRCQACLLFHCPWLRLTPRGFLVRSNRTGESAVLQWLRLRWRSPLQYVQTGELQGWRTLLTI